MADEQYRAGWRGGCDPRPQGGGQPVGAGRRVERCRMVVPVVHDQQLPGRRSSQSFGEIGLAALQAQHPQRHPCAQAALTQPGHQRSHQRSLADTGGASEQAEAAAAQAGRQGVHQIGRQLDQLYRALAVGVEAGIGILGGRRVGDRVITAGRPAAQHLRQVRRGFSVGWPRAQIGDLQVGRTAQREREDVLVGAGQQHGHDADRLVRAASDLDLALLPDRDATLSGTDQQVATVVQRLCGGLGDAVSRGQRRGIDENGKARLAEGLCQGLRDVLIGDTRREEGVVAGEAQRRVEARFLGSARRCRRLAGERVADRRQSFVVAGGERFAWYRQQGQRVGQTFEGAADEATFLASLGIADDDFLKGELRLVGEGQVAERQPRFIEGCRLLVEEEAVETPTEPVKQGFVLLLDTRRHDHEVERTALAQIAHLAGAEVAHDFACTFDVLVVGGAQHDYGVGQQVGTDAAHLGDAGARINENDIVGRPRCLCLRELRAQPGEERLSLPVVVEILPVKCAHGEGVLAVLRGRFALAGGDQVELAAAGQRSLVDREDEAIELPELGRFIERRRAGQALLETLQEIDQPPVGERGSPLDLEIPFESRCFEIEVDRQHPQATPGEDVCDVGQGHRAADAALEGIESEEAGHRSQPSQEALAELLAPIRIGALSLAACQRLG
ncbi:MAG: hypothetical protein AW07_01324 [Candidatus Accumulibacter sp. SK-11]|nr:MAG: hypothetical protein AW07_01324 [Candidatus Accumulibacter sp. SK-11]